MLYKKFFTTSGTGLSTTSRLNAFDKALVSARIDQCNLVPVSSILPPYATPIEYARIPPGSITHCVLARNDGEEGESVSAGVAWAMCEAHETKERFGLVAEDTRKTSDTNITKTHLKEKLDEMADARNMKILEYKTETTSIKEIPKENHGTAITALVYTN